jgi:TPR repeat protein
MIYTNPDNPRYVELAKLATPEANFELSILYDFGIGVRQNPKLSAELLIKSANGGHAEAQSKLAKHYLLGDLNYSKDIDEAVIWYTKAAEQGDLTSQQALDDLHHPINAIKVVHPSFKHELCALLFNDDVSAFNHSEQDIIDAVSLICRNRTTPEIDKSTTQDNPIP